MKETYTAKEVVKIASYMVSKQRRKDLRKNYTQLSLADKLPQVYHFDIERALKA